MGHYKMTAAKSATCSRCGKTVWKSRTSAAVETCLECRRSKPMKKAYTPELRQCRTCSAPFETRTPTQVYCSVPCREKRRGFGNTDRKRASSAKRGYGAEHRRVREQWAARLQRDGGATCCICGHWIDVDESWHLDHTPERDGYRGVAHATCNKRDGAKRGRARQNTNQRWAL